MGAMENAGLRDVHRGLRVPLQGHRARVERRAITILHELAHMWFGDLVTMRWWDDLWLNESFAEWASTSAPAEATQWTDAWTTFGTAREDLGLPPGPAALDAPDRRRHPRPRRRRGQLRRHHLRQGRLGAQAARRVRRSRARSSPGCASYFAEHAWGNTDADRPARRAGDRPPAATWRLVRARGCGPPGVNTLRPDFAVDADGASHVRSRSSRPRPSSSRSCARTASPSGCTAVPTRAWLRTHERSSWTSTAPRTEVPELVGASQPDLVLLNDDDLTYAKIRLDPLACRPRWPTRRVLRQSRASLVTAIRNSKRQR